MSADPLWLPDVNVLFSLAWPEAEMHAECAAWFRTASRAGWATCTLTEAGLLRPSMNPKLIPDPVTPRDVIALLDRWRATAGHRFLSTDLPITTESIPTRHVRGHRQVTDAVLLGLARQHDACLVTLDAGIQSLCPKDWAGHLRVLTGR